MSMKRAPPEPRQLEEDMVQVNVLGAAKEVGRSCIIIRYKGLTIMLDCGIHPGRTGENSLPYFDNGPEASEVDLILISHFHLDHAASLPYFTEKVGGGSFKGRIFATHPTKAIMRLMIQNHIRTDSVRVAGGDEADETLYTEADMQTCLDKIEVIDFHQVMEVKGIRFRCYNAGHVLGAAMFLIEIDNMKILYTGDYSMEDDRHLMAAEVPNKYNTPDILIVESTYGVQNHPPKEEREKRFVDEVSKIVRRGGRCLLPVFALGRAQELMLILDEYWAAHRDLQRVPIYYASYTSDKAHRVYETYVNMMNAHVRQQMDVANPFRFQFVHNLKTVQDVDDFSPSVVLASPGFLNSGHSRQLFDRWCTSEKNGVVMTGYTTEGTLSRTLLTHPETVEDLRGNVQPLRCSVEAISFSAHVDYRQNEGFMKAVKPAIVVLVHGEQNQMNELKKALIRTMQQEGAHGPSIITPDLCTDVRLAVPKRKAARLIGSIADKAQQQLQKYKQQQILLQQQQEEEEEEYQEGNEGEHDDGGGGVTAVMVTKNFTTRLLDPEDLAKYTQLRRGHLLQKVHFPFHQGASILRSFLDELFDDVQQHEEGGQQDDGAAASEEQPPSSSPPIQVTTTFLINQAVKVVVDARVGKAVVEWEAGPMTDMVADAAIALAMEAQCSPVTLRMTSTPCCAHRKVSSTTTTSSSKGDHAHHDHSHTVVSESVTAEAVEASSPSGSEAPPPQPPEEAPDVVAPMDVVDENQEEEEEDGGTKKDTGVEESKASTEGGSQVPAATEPPEGQQPPPAQAKVEEGQTTPEAEAADEGAAASGAANEEGNAASAAPGEAAGAEQQQAVAAAAAVTARPESKLKRRVKMLHRILAAIYGPEHVQADMAIFQLTVSVGGGGEGGKVGFNGEEMIITCSDPSLYEQLETIIHRVSQALYDS